MMCAEKKRVSSTAISDQGCIAYWGILSRVESSQLTIHKTDTTLAFSIIFQCLFRGIVAHLSYQVQFLNLKIFDSKPVPHKVSMTIL